jgi:tRNA dimethylallyltransferase
VKEHTLIVIVGPTAIGKTDFAINIASKLGTEIISCDSRQIYKEMAIGTARPSDEQLAKVKHHFIACKSVHDYYNASMFEFAVLDVLDELFKQHKLVVMTGGSGLYVDAVCKGIDDLPTIDPEVRTQVLTRFQEEGIDNLRKELYRIDPEYSHSADLQNPKRIFKALEVFYMTGKPYSSFLTQNQKQRNFNIVTIALNRDRAELYKNIDLRVDLMVQAGLIEEAKELHKFRQLNALNTVGYKELFDYFEDKTSYETAIELIKRDTRRYAKRQITWFGRTKETQWLQPNEESKAWEIIKPFL